jgi:chromosome segregation ATPase
MTTDYPTLIAELTEKLEASTARIDELRGERRARSLPAAQGDKRAMSAIGKIEAELAVLDSHAATLAIALDEAKKAERDAEIKAAEQERQQRVAEANRIAAELKRTGGEADRQMAALASTLDRRVELIGELSATGVVIRA